MGPSTWESSHFTQKHGFPAGVGPNILTTQELKLGAQSAQTATCSLGGEEAGLEAPGWGVGGREEGTDWTLLVFFTRFSLINRQVANTTK